MGSGLGGSRVLSISCPHKGGEGTTRVGFCGDQAYEKLLRSQKGRNAEASGQPSKGTARQQRCLWSHLDCYLGCYPASIGPKVMPCVTTRGHTTWLVPPT
jgi:hypothetical protein